MAIAGAGGDDWHRLSVGKVVVVVAANKEKTRGMCSQRRRVQWLAVFSLPYLDGTLETLDRTYLLLGQLLLAALVASTVAHRRRLTPMFHFDAFVSSPDTGAEEQWSGGSHNVSPAALALVFASLGYGIVSDMLLSSLPDAQLFGAIACFSVAGALFIYFAVLVYKTSNGCTTLAYFTILAAWLLLFPLAYEIGSPWNILLISLIAAVASPALVIVCTRRHTRQRQLHLDHGDARFSVVETQFRRHMLRWLSLAAYTVVVYAVASIYDDDAAAHFTAVFIALSVTNLGVLALALLYSFLCTGRKRIAASSDANAAAAATTPQTRILDARSYASESSVNSRSAESSTHDGLDAFFLSGRRR